MLSSTIPSGTFDMGGDPAALSEAGTAAWGEANRR
jgi:hypothetical protein